MYTRCPSCRAQISFELPQSADSFPEGYKHKIKCPSCGVTIGVKIPRVDATATVQPTYTPANPAASTFEPTYTAAAPVPETRAEHKADEKAAKKANKKSGIGRNIVIMIFSLLFVALSTVGYLVNKGTLSGLPVWTGGINAFDGIGLFESLINKSFTQPGDIKGWIEAVLPAALFVFAGVNFIIALISAIGKKYGRAWNFIAALLMLAIGVFVVILPVIFGTNFMEHFMGENGIITKGKFFMFAGAGLGILQFIFALCFCKSLNRKVK